MTPHACNCPFCEIRWQYTDAELDAMYREAWTHRCQECRREFIADPADRPSFCSSDCSATSHRRRRQADWDRATTTRLGAIAQGRPFCHATANRGTPCMAPPIYGAQYCQQHADPEIVDAKHAGAVLADMAVDDEFAGELAARWPNPYQAVIDATRRVKLFDLLARWDRDRIRQARDEARR